MNAEIISIGDELASGQTLDTNSQWLSRRLNALGIRVLFHTTVGDRLDANLLVFREAVRRADLVIATGGLGPTADDLTRQVLALLSGKKLIRDDETLRRIQGLFARRGRPMPPQNELQAWFPEGSRVVANPHGTAPGIAMEVPRENQPPCHVIALPGVPAELFEMWDQTVVGMLRELGLGGRIVRHRLIKCFGAGESHIESMLPDLIRRDRTPCVGITASNATIILRITAEGADEDECQTAMEPTVATIHECLGELIFGEDDTELQDIVVRLLGERNQTLAVAEWGTAGTVTQWLRSASPEGVIRGGIVVADAEALRDAIGVSAQTLATQPAAGAEITQAMAREVRSRFDADYGLATGCFPEYNATTKPQPLYFAWADAESAHSLAIPFAAHPAVLCHYCAKSALNLARLELMHRTRLARGDSIAKD